MKIKVEYSESIQIAEGLWRKIGVELEDEGDPDELYSKSKDYVQKWHTEANDRPSVVSEIVDTTPKVINREHERYEILIENAKTIEELAAHKNSMPRELLPSYMNKLRELTKKI